MRQAVVFGPAFRPRCYRYAQGVHVGAPRPSGSLALRCALAERSQGASPDVRKAVQVSSMSHCRVRSHRRVPLVRRTVKVTILARGLARGHVCLRAHNPNHPPSDY